MKKLKKVLEKLEVAGMCVHVIDHSRLGDFGVPLARLVSNTHYVMQKNKGAEFGLGGGRTMEKARLVLNIEPGRFKITKAKNFADPKMNPNGLECKWKLVNGCKFIMRGQGWDKVSQKN